MFPTQEIYNLLIYQRDSIAQGEVWRLFTGQLLHLNIEHFIYNMIAFLLLYTIAAYLHSKLLFWLSIIWCSSLTGIGLFFISYQVTWYAGASGFLHGVAVVLIVQLMQQYYFLGLLFLLMLILKLIHEQIFGTIGQFDFKVIVDAHLIGFISGCIYLIYNKFANKARHTV